MVPGARVIEERIHSKQRSGSHVGIKRHNYAKPCKKRVCKSIRSSASLNSSVRPAGVRFRACTWSISLSHVSQASFQGTSFHKLRNSKQTTSISVPLVPRNLCGGMCLLSSRETVPGMRALASNFTVNQHDPKPRERITTVVVHGALEHGRMCLISVCRLLLSRHDFRG